VIKITLILQENIRPKQVIYMIFYGIEIHRNCILRYLSVFIDMDILISHFVHFVPSSIWGKFYCWRASQKWRRLVKIWMKIPI